MCLAEKPRATYSDMARYAGVDQRTVVRQLDRLESAGYITRAGAARAMRISLNLEAPVDGRRTSATVGDLLRTLLPSADYRSPDADP